MESSFILQSLLLIHLQYLCFTAGQVNHFPFIRCKSIGTFTGNSIYQQNLETALASLPTAATRYGFYNATVGVAPNTVTSAALCRGDIGPETCRDCITASIPLLRQNCSNELRALIWNSDCSVRYSNRTFISAVDLRPLIKLSSSVNASDVDAFGEALRELGKKQRTEAAAGNSMRKLATGVAEFGSDSVKIYGLMQCSPDLSAFDCNYCLSTLFTESQTCCDGDIDVSIFFPTCIVRYSNASFYNDPPVITLPSTTKSAAKSGGRKNSQKSMHAVVPIACVCVGLVIIGLCFLLIRRRKKKAAINKQDRSRFSSLLRSGIKTPSGDIAKSESVEMEIGTVRSLQFDLATIEAATNNFLAENKIGQGGFGPVYKGVFDNGMEVAVKRLSKSSGQGLQEFINEVILMAKLQHRNLVRLLGFCLDADEKLLIYEYVSNKSLDYFLFDPSKHGQLNWPERYKIIVGITRGMLYLHGDSRLTIIHRDLKSSNILLDSDMNPKISDFGLARIVGVDQTEANTNRIVGTYGYMSPEYAVHGHFSVKSDVFAFGVVVLEIITGNKSSRFYNEDAEEDLPHFAWTKWIEGCAMELIDPTIVETCSKDEVMRCINIGLLCVQEDVDIRPSMAYVLNMLNNYTITLPSPTRTPHYLPKRNSYISSSKSASASNSVGLSQITEVHAR